VLVVGKHRGGDSDVHATVEEVIDRATEAWRPGDRDGQVADGGPAALGEHVIDDLTCFGYRVGSVVRVEVREIADEVLIPDAELRSERVDQVVVEVNATRENEG
jgi:hypothetical protein